MPRTARNNRRTPNSLGTIEKLPSGRYRAFYRADGEKYTAPRTFPTKDEATAWLAGERADRARGVWADPHAQTMTLSDYADSYLASRADLAPRTLHGYRRLIERYIDSPVKPRRGRALQLGATDLADITPALVRSWHAAVVDAAAESAKAHSMRGRTLAPLHPARAWAIAQGIDVKPTGQLPSAVVDAWRKAGAPVPAPRTLPPLAHTAATGEATAARAYRVLHTICGAAVGDCIIETNPCRIRRAGADRHAERPTATPAEVAQLARLMPQRLSAAVTVAAWSGLRRGELFALARRHVDVHAGTVTVERALLELPRQPITFTAPKTAKSRRTVALPGFVMAELQAHLDAHVPDEPDALVFASTRRTPLSYANVSVLFRRARVAIGRPELHWHDLRHTGATLAYAAGASVPEVQRRLGHTTMRAAQIYMHTANDSDRVLADRLDALYAAQTMHASSLVAVL